MEDLVLKVDQVRKYFPIYRGMLWPRKVGDVKQLME